MTIAAGIVGFTLGILFATVIYTVRMHKKISLLEKKLNDEFDIVWNEGWKAGAEMSLTESGVTGVTVEQYYQKEEDIIEP